MNWLASIRLRKSIGLPSLPSQKISWSLSVRLKWKSEILRPLQELVEAWSLHRLYQIKNPENRRKIFASNCLKVIVSFLVAVYLSDLLSNQRFLNRIGRIIAKAFRAKVMLSCANATKGSSLAKMQWLECSICHCPSWFNPEKGQPLVSTMFRIEWGSHWKCSFKRRLKAGSRSVIVDDFLKVAERLTGWSVLAELILN